MPAPENYDPQMNIQLQDNHNALQTILRFLQSLLRRKWTVMAWLTFTVSLGMTYFALAPRKYESSAELLVLHTGDGNVDQTQQSQRTLQDYLPTYTKVLASDEVLKGALVRLPDTARTKFIGMTKHQAIEKLRSSLTVNTARQTNLLEVKYCSESPEESSTIVTEILNSYFKFMHEMHESSSGQMLDTLTKERDNIQNQILVKQSELLDLQRESDSLIGTGDNVMSVVNERVIELNHALAKAQQESIQARSYYTAVEQAVRNGESLQQLMNQSNQTLANELMKLSAGVDSRDSYAYARLQQQLIEDESSLRDKLNGKLGPNHPEVLELQERVKAARDWMNGRGQQASQDSKQLTRDMGPQMLEMAKQRYQHAVTHEQDIYQRFMQEKQLASQMNQRLMLLQLAERDLSRLQSDYDMMRDRINTIDLNKQSSLRTRITKHAEPNRTPVTPKLTNTLLLSILAGLFFGATTVLLLDLLDDRFHSPDELKRELGAPVMAMVRSLPTLPHTHGLESIFTYTKPNSVETEAFRTLRTSIEFACENHQRISITSTQPSDGKTTVISNTAVAFAQAGKKTLIIDGDMRRPGLTAVFALKGQAGLSTILRDTATIEESASKYITKTRLENLDVISAGPRPSNPVELLTSERFEELIGWAEGVYDQILIDAPPSLAVTDPAIIGRLVDGIILTVRPDRNKRRMILRAAESVTSLGGTLLGVVVNGLSDSRGEYGYGYGYGYGEGYGEGHDDPTNEVEEEAIPISNNNSQRPRKRFSRDQSSDRYAA
ncbi:MAG TPA: hypothetical protein DD473_08855 [Planctomycetaceae bacterium]|nr:hypothetical protein [Planctomycetaceae bacterium]